jgi:ferredoxin
MRLVVNLTRCEGYGQCAFLAPGVFRTRGSEVLIDDPVPGEGQHDRVLRAAAACPVQAIRVDRIASREGLGAASTPVLAAAVPAQRTARGFISAAVGAFRRSGPFPPEFRAVDQPPVWQPVPVGMPAREIRDRHATVTATGHDPSERRAELVYHDL